ncbi:MAG: RNA polymerase sigma factor [Acidimicrobiales bacterium]
MDPPGHVEAGFVAMYEEHYARIVRALELDGLGRPSAEDAAQEAFARTLGHWARVRGGSNPAGYVYRTAFRLSRRRFRREIPISGEPGVQPDTAGDTTIRVSAERVLGSMPQRRRSVAVLCLVIGLSTKDAGRALGIAEGTVRKHLELARRDLRQALGE